MSNDYESSFSVYQLAFAYKNSKLETYLVEQIRSR